MYLKVIYHPLYGMNNFVLIWGDWLSCDLLRGSHDSQSPHIYKFVTNKSKLPQDGAQVFSYMG